jgi:hypothetical protein
MSAALAAIVAHGVIEIDQCNSAREDGIELLSLVIPVAGGGVS